MVQSVMCQCHVLHNKHKNTISEKLPWLICCTENSMNTEYLIGLLNEFDVTSIWKSLSIHVCLCVTASKVRMYFCCYIIFSAQTARVIFSLIRPGWQSTHKHRRRHWMFKNMFNMRININGLRSLICNSCGFSEWEK